MAVFWGLMIPFTGTVLGAAMVFLMKREMPAWVEKLLAGFAAGVMIAASVWSLLIPSMEMTGGRWAFVPACVGFLAGVAFLLILDSLTPHLHVLSGNREGLPLRIPPKVMLFFAVTLHNIPEGMAVGVAFAAAVSQGMNVTLASAAALSIGIAIQNFPEGAIVSMPFRSEGLSRRGAFALGALSGAVEPIAGFVTYLVTASVLTAMPYLLAFAAGAMIYVVVEELIPESQVGEHSNIATIGLALGFALMMVLDVALG